MRARRTLFTTILLVAALGTPSTQAAWEWGGLHGKLRAQGYGYVTRLVDFDDFASRTDFTLELSLADGDTWTAKAVPWAWVLAPHAIGGDTARGRAFGDLKEGWVEHARPAWDARAGYQIFAWGSADGVNPVDVMNPRDLTDLVDSEKLAVPALRVRLHPPAVEDWSLELVGGPTFRGSRLPAKLSDDGVHAFRPEDGRWLVAVPSFVSGGGVLTPLRYEMRKATYPTTLWGGLRLGTRAIGDWDLSLTYIDAVEQEPRLAATQRGAAGDPDLPVTVELHPSYHRNRLVGLDGSTVLELGEEELGLRFEAAYIVRSNVRADSAPEALQSDLMKDDVIHAVAGVDYTLPGRVLGTGMYVNLQYGFYERVGDREGTPGISGLPSLPTALPWDRDLILVAQNTFASKYTLETQAIWSHRRGDGVLRPSLTTEWTDTLSTRIGADLFFGNRSGFFGQYFENARGSLRIEWVF
ncbi:MAG: hypothetical protein IT285_06455 [Bdellovibrionales bacterium]|nr:hypothetical protein [Bdellovibrionales bacterium]